MKFRLSYRRLTGFVFLIFILVTCTPKPFFFRANYKNANSLLHETKNLQEQLFLKAHLKNGDVYILKDSWEVDTILNQVTGNGSAYDFNRNKTSEGLIAVPLDSVAIFETNKKLGKTESKRITALAILAGVDVALGAFCITNPKACFGSCPTFYIDEEDNFHYSDAEGFSNAIAPSMEYFDIDALNNDKVTGNTFSITMKNEALETHVIKSIKLFAVPRKKGQRAYHSPGNEFYISEDIYELEKARASEGDITALLKSADRRERFSPADEHNLSSKEEIYLDFKDIRAKDAPGLLINFRQTLMTTYFIYSAMGYMGDEVGDIFTKLETSNHTREKLEKGIKKELGDIEIYALDHNSKEWIYQGGVNETGPVAINRQVLPLDIAARGGELKIKVVLNKGLWRIDSFALTNILEKASPVEILPSEVLNKGVQDTAAREEIIAADDYLISMPGSEYKMKFLLPANHEDYELFLYSEGYYLEWMREKWIKDKDLLKLRQMIENPQRYLLQQAEDYKEYEKTMEQQFWNSKIDTKSFSYYGT